MKKILFISLLFLSCIYTANAQWQQVLQGGGGGLIYTYRGNLLCTTNNGIYVSTDTGKTWKITDTNPALKWVTIFAPKDSLLFGANFEYGYMYVSADSGKTWKPVTTYPGLQIQCMIFSGDTLLVGADPDSMYLSPDYGQHWIPSSKGLPREPVNSGITYFSFINMGSQTIVFFGDASYITLDHGLTWQIKSKKCPPGFNVIALGSDIYNAENANIIRSADTTLSWSNIFSGGNDMSSFCTDGHYLLAAGEDMGIAMSKDSGNSWAVINNGLPNNYYAVGAAILGSYIFCSFYLGPGYVFRMPLAEADTFTPVKIMNGIKPLPAGLPSLNIYPDPVQHSATVNFGQPLQNGSLQIFNMQGQRVQQIDQITGAKITLQPNNLPPGTYTYLLTEQGKQTAAGKFIIQ